MLSCKVKVKHNFSKINKVIKELPKSVATGIEEVLKNLQCEAVKLEKGHNQEGIIVERVELSTGKIKGRIYADPAKFMTVNKKYDPSTGGTITEDICYLLMEYYRNSELMPKWSI